jgi:hypothetical protein
MTETFNNILKVLDTDDEKVLANIDLAVQLLREAQDLLLKSSHTLYAEADANPSSGEGCPNHLGHIRNDKAHYLKLATNQLLSTTDNLKDMLSIRP